MDVIFEGDPVYQLDPDIAEYSWWPDRSLFFDKGRWYLSDLPDLKSLPEDIKNMHSIYFGGKKIRYRMLPACYVSDGERKPHDIKIIDNR